MKARNCHLGMLAGLALVSSPAFAQSPAPESSVQIYGTMSAGLTYKNNQAGGGHQVEMTNALLSSSLIGFRGREDLGDGLGAVFRLESGINVDDGRAGSSSTFWNRQSFVGLDWKGRATLTLGRQFAASTDRVTQSLDVYNVAGPALDTQPLAVFGVNRYAGNDTRVDNSVKLRLQGPAGTTLGLSAAVKEGGGNNYAFDLAQITDSYTVAAYGTRIQAPSVIATTGHRPEHEVFGVGGNMNLGPAVLYLNLVRATLDSTTAGRPQQKNSIVSIGARYRIGAVTLKSGYTYDKGTDLNGSVGRNGTKQTLVASAEYAFSRRTSVYVAAYTNRFSDGYRFESLNIAGMNRDPAASSLSGYSIGMSHRF